MNRSAQSRRVTRLFPPISLALLAFAIIPPTAVHAQCVSYEDHLHWEGSAGGYGYARRIAVTGSHAYVANERGLLVLNLADPSAPAVVTELNTPGSTRAVAAEGDRAYLAAAGYVYVVDISQPGSPTILSTVTLQGYISDVVVSGSAVYVTRENDDRISAVDVSDPNTPTIAAEVPLSSAAKRLTVEGDHLYVGTSDGLVILDISTPLSPFITGTSAGYSAHKTVVSGDYAVVPTGIDVRVVDVSDPSSPAVVGSVATLGLSWGAALSGTTALVSEQVRGSLTAVDFSDPTSPQIVGSVVLPGAEARDVVRVGQHLLITAYHDNVQVVGCEIPASPSALVGSVGILDGATSVATLGGVTCVGGPSGLQVLDVSDLSAPAVIGSYPLSTTIDGIAMAGSRAYLASSNMLHVIDLTDPSTPTAISTTATTGMKERVFVDGVHAYVLNHHYVSDVWYVEVYDILNELAPVRVGSVAVEDARDLAVDGTWAYVNDTRGITGLQVVDLSDPLAPAVAAVLPLPGATHMVTVSGSIASLTSGNAVYAVDVTEPTAPVFLGSAPHPGSSHDIVGLGSYVYTATDTRGVHVVNVGTVPPEIVGTFDTWGPAVAIVESGGRVQVVTGGQLSPLWQFFPLFQVLEPQCEAALAAPLAGPAIGVSVGAVWPQPALGVQSLQLTLLQAANVRVRVHDVRGAVVRTLVDRRLQAGVVTLHWDGRNEFGRPLPAGVYFLRGDGGASFARKAVRLR